MDKKHNNDILIFSSVLLLIAAGFVVGTNYIKGGVAAVPGGSGLLADISTNVAAPQASSSTTTSTSQAASTSSLSASANVSTTVATPSSTTIVFTSSDSKPPVVPFVSTPTSAATTSPKTSPSPTRTSTVAAKPTTPAPIALTLPYTENNFSGDKNWMATWGNLTVDSNGFLEIGTTPNGTGAGVHLDNSMSWTDYIVTASLDWVGGRNFSITARYHDDGDLVLCNYNEEAPGTYIISLQQYVKGRELTLAQSDPINLNDVTTRPNTTVSIEVDSVNGWCSLDDYRISNAVGGAGTYLINAPYSGGIGFTMWDETPNASKLIIKSVNVMQE